MGLDYRINLAKPGMLSGELVVVGKSRYSTKPELDEEKEVLMPAFMGTGREDPKFIKNARQFHKKSMPRRFVQPYGSRDCRMVHTGYFFLSEGYELGQAFPNADIAVVSGAPVIEFFHRAKDVMLAEHSDYGIPSYMKGLFERYESDFKRGKLSKRVIWHVESSADFMIYWWVTRALERARRKLKRREKRNDVTFDVVLRIEDLEKILR